MDRMDKGKGVLRLNDFNSNQSSVSRPYEQDTVTLTPPASPYASQEVAPRDDFTPEEPVRCRSMGNSLPRAMFNRKMPHEGGVMVKTSIARTSSSQGSFPLKERSYLRSEKKVYNDIQMLPSFDAEDEILNMSIPTPTRIRSSRFQYTFWLTGLLAYCQAAQALIARRSLSLPLFSAAQRSSAAGPNGRHITLGLRHSWSISVQGRISSIIPFVQISTLYGLSFPYGSSLNSRN